ncbi:hypothetical protein ACP275_01G110000 [Erythranthe tilingii]
MVMISGSSVQNFTGRGDFQELDQIAAVKHFSKFSTKATDITKIPTFVFAAIDWAATGVRDAPTRRHLPRPPHRRPPSNHQQFRG